VVEVLTDADTELRLAQDPRVTVELALLKLVQLRRLMPFAELVDRVEKMAGGVAPAPRAAAGVSAAPGPPAVARTAAPATAKPGAVPAAAPASHAVPAPAFEPTITAPAENLLGALAAQAQARPSLAQPLKGAQLREEGDALVLEVQPDFFRLAETHLDEYLDLVRKVSGRARKVRIVAAETADAPAADAPKEDERRKARDEAVGEPAVQEALDLFGGRVVDVRESKPS
jgi:DNA polymerase-3 subunit gamma/tau